MSERRARQPMPPPTSPGPWRRCAWILAAAALITLATPGEAMAWGPVTHIGLGSSVLGSLAFLPVAVATILRRHGGAFLYGSIAADIVFAKRLSRIKQSCHHWSTGLGLLDGATDDRARAFAYGYLAHLAADTVAHGKYIPHQIALSRTSVNFGHLYWELRADAAESAAARRLLARVVRQDHSVHHEALAPYIKDTFLPYDLNRLVFDWTNAFAKHRGFRRTVDLWGRCSRWYLSPDLLGGYRAESVERIISVLSQERRSEILREDPNGTSAFMQLRVRRREARRLKRRGMPVRHRFAETSHTLTPRTASRAAAEVTAAGGFASTCHTP